MNFSLKGAFAAAAIAFAVSGPALAQDTNEQTNPVTITTQDNQQIAARSDAAELRLLLARASDANFSNLRYNTWFLNQMMANIQRMYVEDVTMQEMQTMALDSARKLSAEGPYTVDQYIEATLDGILNTLDPHSDYMNADEWRAMTEQTQGGFVGIGVQIQMDDTTGYLQVVNPINGGPAGDAGVQAGDFITHIDGVDMQGKTIEEYTEKLRGAIGSQVDIQLQRQGESTPIDVTITRDMIESSPIVSHQIGDIGYIRITSFSGITTEKLEEAVAELQQSMGESNIKGYVLDLRFNPGGLLNEAIGVVDSFINSGGIVATSDATGTNLSFAQATPGDITHGKPIAVLVNGASASASEIVAGALQDNNRATIIGTQTFGKGSVQSVIPLGAYYQGREDGVRITTQLYYTPSGDTIQNKGVTPDIRTEFQGTVSDGRIGTSEAELAGVIANPNLVQDDHQTRASCDVSPTSPDISSLSDEFILQLRDGTTEPDYQLLCAVEHLRGSSEFTEIKPLNVQQMAPAPQP